MATPYTTDEQKGDGVDISAPRARQAYPGKRILLILMVSLAAVVIAFIVAFVANPTTGANGQGASMVKDPALAQTFHAPQPQPKNPGAPTAP